MSASKRAPLPPRWFIRAAWVVHRAIYVVTGGRRGLRSPTAERWGMLRLRTVGRRTGRERIAIRERPRLWARWAVHDEKLDAHAALRSRQTQVVILEPRSD